MKNCQTSLVFSVFSLLLSALSTSSLHAGALPWEEHISPGYPKQQTVYQTESLMHEPHYQRQHISYQKPVNPIKCSGLAPQQLHENCIIRSNANQEGLRQQIRYLQKQRPQQRMGEAWAKVSNAALLETANELMTWDERLTPHSFAERFYLHKIPSAKSSAKADFTGYFTPVIEARYQPSAEFRYPIYAAPRWGSSQYTRAQIDNGALRGRGLELAWTNDPVGLYFAHIQGSVITRFANGEQRLLDYAANNGYTPVSIANYLQSRGYLRDNLSNDNIRRWLRANPQHLHEVLHQNPRYIYFNFSDRRPQTATGAGVIPLHTVAVDDNYIPLGSVLLAEIPRIDSDGNIIGSDWRLLFAQDKGESIKGSGRLDIYTGVGKQAEQATYSMTGLYKAWLLIRRPGFGKHQIAQLLN